ncbi:MAG TPA: cereblon family protein [Spirochaetota bacterium]|nr:cereblon family protein [Spirochaetota bacterium]
MEHVLSVEYRGAGARPCVPFAALQQVDDRSFSTTEIRDVPDHETDWGKKNILCKTCGNPITSDEAGIAMNGSHEHTFMNPRGMVFRIGCFSKAAGCFIVGSPTDEYTWFPGFAWCCVICARCQSHLGWHYRSGGSGFFGLILDQLVRQ